jgi:hypothetical protein
MTKNQRSWGFLIALGVFFLTTAAAGSGNPRATNGKLAGERFVSPDSRLIAVVIPNGKENGAPEKNESRVEIRGRKGDLLHAYDFSSDDGSHGYGVDGAQWTADSQFFVFRMRSSGGHSPMWAPVVYWSRKTTHFYELSDYTGDIEFSVTAPDTINVSTSTDMHPAVVSLHELKPTQVTELRQNPN